MIGVALLSGAIIFIMAFFVASYARDYRLQKLAKRHGFSIVDN